MFGLLVFYGCFLSNNIASTTPTITIARMIAATEGMKYISLTDGGVVVGPEVASGAASTANAVVACDGQ